MEQLIEILAERSHIGWMQEKQRQGFADHRYEAGPLLVNTGDVACIRCYGPRDKHHADMLLYAALPEHVKEYDRVTVRGVLEGIENAGYALVAREGLRQLRNAVALLNSMVLSGEQHSETSRTAVREALNAAIPA